MMMIVSKGSQVRNGSKSMGDVRLVNLRIIDPDSPKHSHGVVLPVTCVVSQYDEDHYQVHNILDKMYDLIRGDMKDIYDSLERSRGPEDMAKVHFQ